MLKLTAEGCAARRQRLCAAVEADLFILTHPHHILYFSGVWLSSLSLGSAGAHALLIDRDGSCALLTHAMMASQARAGFADEVVVYPSYSPEPPSLSSADPYGAFVGALNRQIEDRAAQTIGYERGGLPDGIAAVRRIDLNATLRALRRRKDDDELALIRQAVSAVEAGHAALRAAIRPGITEIDAFIAAQDAITRAISGPVHMLGDFVSGPRAEYVGGPPTTRALLPGDVMIADIFPVIAGYRADFTATIAVGGGLSAVQQRLDDALHDALAAGESVLRAGTRAADVYHAVRHALDTHGFGAHFPHHAGHGIGLGHPEPPYFVPDSDERLVAGDVVTLEPGAYGSGFAGRIEHNYLITETGAERLTNHVTRMAG
ncbi:MAG: aminopeptidase P family protein [Anaerolineae bacterium]|nr:aminopeptidase P family protein [Anaerolineae bacterium]